jgi:hypothetical protein
MGSPLQLGFDGHHRIRNHSVTRTIDPMESIERVYRWAMAFRDEYSAFIA